MTFYGPTIKNLIRPRTATMVVFAVILSFGAFAQAQTYTIQTIHAFNGSDGAYPTGNLISDAAGNLYGVTSGGGLQNSNTTGCMLGFPHYFYCGEVFKLSPTTKGGWARTILYEFTGGTDGGDPVAGLTLDSAGNLYGTTAWGGLGYGVVYELSPTGSNSWSESVLYSFHGTEGSNPESQIVFDAAGNLYGTTYNGGSGDCGFGISCGAVFELSPSSAGWTETTIYNFASVSDGIAPMGPVAIDSHGNLFGTTSQGGSLNNVCGYPYYGCGTVFELSPASGGWTKSTLYSFNGGTDGAYPRGGVIIDRAGNLYGSGFSGGDINGCVNDEIPGCGVIFTIRPASSGWHEAVLHFFTPVGSNIGQGGGLPSSTLTFDASGNLYGTAQGGVHKGGALGAGVVFRLSRSAKSWNETVLHTFSGTDGASPTSNLIIDASGSLIGTTAAGGPTSNSAACQNSSCGVVYELKP